MRVAEILSAGPTLNSEGVSEKSLRTQSLSSAVPYSVPLEWVAYAGSGGVVEEKRSPGEKETILIFDRDDLKAR